MDRWNNVFYFVIEASFAVIVVATSLLAVTVLLSAIVYLIGTL